MKSNSLYFNHKANLAEYIDWSTLEKALTTTTTSILLERGIGPLAAQQNGNKESRTAINCTQCDKNSKCVMKTAETNLQVSFSMSVSFALLYFFSLYSNAKQAYKGFK